MGLIVTLRLDDESQAFFERLRQRFFPPERNLIPAHLSLFHNLPDTAHTRDTLQQIAATQRPFQLTDPQWKSLGGGVAAFFRSPQAVSLHKQISSEFSEEIIPQDRQGLRPHVVVQNKVSSETARKTLQTLQQETVIPPHVTAVGLDYWVYAGGPWTDHSFSVFPS